ncbi:MAG: AsmA-like C-terminal region-containing protein [Desulfovibrionaceae bacterium]
MKRIVYILIAVLVVLGAAGAIAISRIDTAALTQKIADITREATGKPLLLAQTPSISVMPLGVSFGPASWGLLDGKAAAQGISVAIQGGSISMQLLPLLSGKIVVNEITLNSPTVTVRPEAKTIAAAEDATIAPTAKAEPLTIPPLELARLSITNGTVDMDLGTGQILRLTALDIRLSDLMPGKEASTAISTHISLSKADSKSPLLAGALTEKMRVRLSPTHVDFQGLEITFTPEKGLIPAAVGPIRLTASGSYALPNEQLKLQAFSLGAAHANLTCTGEANLSPLTFKGTYTVKAAPDKLLPSLGIAAPLPTMPESFTHKGSINFADNTLTIPDYVGTLDRSNITASLKVALAQAGKNPLTITNVIHIDSLNLDHYLGATQGHAKTNAPSPTKADKAASSAPLNAAALPTLDIDISIKSLTAHKIPLTNIRLVLKGSAGRYAANPLSLDLGTGGTFRSSATVDLATMRYTSQGKLAQLNVGALLQAVQGKSPVNGSAQMDYTLACGGSTAHAIKSSLSGKGQLLVQNILLKDVTLLPKDAPHSGNIPSNFERLHVPFTIKNGIMNINPLTLTSPSLKAKGLGTVNLPAENLQMSADISMLGVSLPVVASGPFSNLSYGLDPKKMLQGVGSVVKGAGNLLQQGGKSGAQGVDSTLKNLFRR